MMMMMTPERSDEIRTGAESQEMSPRWVRAAVRDLFDEIERLSDELRRLRDDVHSGHVLIPYDPVYHHRRHQHRLGWMICAKSDCTYETPSRGWCPEHRTLDVCWARARQSTEPVMESGKG